MSAFIPQNPNFRLPPGTVTPTPVTNNPGFGTKPIDPAQRPTTVIPGPGISKPGFQPKPINPNQKPKVPVATKPKPPSELDKWLAKDSTYQQQLAQFLKEQNDYSTQYTGQTQKVNRDYNNTQRQMNKTAVEDRLNQQNDYAGRGILSSGVYAKALTNYNSSFNTKIANLLQGRTDQLTDLSNGRTNFLRQLNNSRAQAKQDAIRRRAAQLGI